MTADCIVVLGGPAWEDSANQTSMQSARALSTELPVFYVSRSDPRPIRQRLRELGRRRRRRPRRTVPASMPEGRGTLHVVHLPAWTDWVPLVRPSWARAILRSMLMRSIRTALRGQGLRRPGLIAYWWMFPEIVARKDWQYRVFDVIDRHWGYVYLSGDAEIALNLSLAVATARASDRVVAVSEPLAEELRDVSGVRVESIPNALDVSRVERILRSTGRADQDRNRRRAVYVGGWNDRVDFALFEQVARDLPDWHFIVVGAESRLAQPNVEFLGDLSYEDAISAMATASVGLLPFRDNEYTRSSSFLKAFDYLAAGLTVLATPLPGTLQLAETYPGLVLVVERDDWVARLSSESWRQKSRVLRAAIPDTRRRSAMLLRHLDPDLADKLDSGTDSPQ
jgi:glycosyltransferase involved in cell wall biosynthesis